MRKSHSIGNNCGDVESSPGRSLFSRVALKHTPLLYQLWFNNFVIIGRCRKCSEIGLRDCRRDKQAPSRMCVPFLRIRESSFLCLFVLKLNSFPTRGFVSFFGLRSLRRKQIICAK